MASVHTTKVPIRSKARSVGRKASKVEHLYPFLSIVRSSLAQQTAGADGLLASCT